jgi:phosphoribosyl 1,2-cyclic phosphodiesterase
MAKSGTTDLSVRFRGVRGSTPSPGKHTARYGGNTSCVEVRSGDEILILDAGTGIREFGKELISEFGARAIEATLLISHTHWDHIQGLPFFAPGFSAANRIRVMGAHGYGPRVERGLRNQTDGIHFPVGLDQMRGLLPVEELPNARVSLGAFTIAVTELNHPGGCAGFRIEGNGASVAYLPDHEPFASENYHKTDALVDFVRGVDLLILDTQYTETEYPQRIGWGHGCLPDSIALAVAAHVRQIALFHLDPTHTDEQIDAMVVAGRRLARGSELIVRGAVEQELITLSPSHYRLMKSAAA